MTKQQHLSDHIRLIQTEMTMMCVEHWRVLFENRIEERDLREVLQKLIAMEKRIQYAKNCCHWIHEEIEEAKPKYSPTGDAGEN